MTSDPVDRAGAILEIDLGGIVENWRLLAGKASPALCAGVVKANAYGLGAVPVARALAAAGCRMLFVATLDEAISLRQELGEVPEIAVLNGSFPGTAGEFTEHGLIPVLNEPGQIAEWRKLSNPPPPAGEGWVGATARAVGAKPVGVSPRLAAVPEDRSDTFATRSGSSPHPALPRKRGRVPREPFGARPSAILHIDTGMARLGLTAREFAAVAEHPPRITWRALMSHLACGDTPDHPMNGEQRARFAAAAARMPGVAASLAASSGIFLGPSYHFDLVRPGAALFGVNPQPGRPNPLRQVVRLNGKILQVRQIDRGKSVGYGAAHVMRGPGRVATVAVGYADGWLRSLGHRGCGQLAGMRVPLIGRVSMDLVTFDVSAVDPALARPGAMIELLGENYAVDDAAADAGTIGYEILTALGARYHRVYRDPTPADLPTNLPG